MAKAELIIHDVVTKAAAGSTPAEVVDVTMSIGDSMQGGSFSKVMPVMERDLTASKPQWVQGSPCNVNIKLSIGTFNVRQRMFNPDEVVVDFSLTPEIDTTSIVSQSGSGTSSSRIERKVVFEKNDMVQLFGNRKVTLKFSNLVEGQEVGYTAGNDFYVHEVIPQKYPDKMIVTLKIFSPDKMLTLSQYCRCFTAKKLSAHILANELANYKLPYDSKNTVKSDATKMKHLIKDGKEHIFPYLVQYNESFYDLLARTTNRWGEFMYYYDGKLRIGFDDDETKAEEISGYHSITYRDCTADQPKQANAGKYVGEAPYDNNVLNSVVEENSADTIKNTVKNAFDMEAGGDVYLMKKVSQVLNNSKSLKNFLFDTAVDDLIAWAQVEVRVKGNNDKLYDDYFGKKKNYISKLDDQYDLTVSPKTYNQFSESKPIVDASVYATILEGEMKAANNIIDIDYNVTAPGMHLGQLIKVDGNLYIVTEIAAFQPEIFTKVNNEYYERGVDTGRMLFRVTAIAKDGKSYYPTMIPSGHVRKSGPQVAVVVDADDPKKVNRVRVKYPWQLTSVNASYEKIKADDLKSNDLSDASPWLFYASASGPTKSGVHGRHYVAEKVLVDFANGNVERPFVVGAVSADIPVPLKLSSAVIMSPGNQFVKVHDGLGYGAASFIANLSPGLKMINGFVPLGSLDWFSGLDTKESHYLEGGVEMGDKYGIWSIKGSTDTRNISISSPWGDVKLNAFTGITVSAPNGDIKISGKNVAIEAGNNLTLTSGKNIKNKFISLYGDGAAYNAINFATDVANMVSKKLVDMTLSIVDLSIVRQVVEVFWKPQEGVLSLSSNRYLKLSAGGASAGYPDAVYKNPKERAKKQLEENGLLSMGPAMCDLIGKVPTVIQAMCDAYKEKYKDCIKKKGEFEHALERLAHYSDGNVEQCCKQYDDLKNLLWDPSTKEITKTDLDFKDPVKDDSIDDVGLGSMINVAGDNANGVLGRNRNFLIFSPKEGDAMKKYIITKRKEHKEDVVKKANALLKSITKLRELPLRADAASWYGYGTCTKYVPADYVAAFQKAFSPEKCKDSAFYKYAYNENNVITDERTALTEQAMRRLDLHYTALERRVSMNLVEGWGMEPAAVKLQIVNNAVVDAEAAAVPQKPTTDADLENDAKWELYVKSLQFTKVVKKDVNFMKTAVLDALKKAAVWTPIGEYYSWGNAKSGEILFAAGSTYRLKTDGSISKIDAPYNQGKFRKALLSDEDQRKYDALNDQVHTKLLGIRHFVDEFEVIAPADDGVAVGGGVAGGAEN